MSNTSKKNFVTATLRSSWNAYCILSKTLTHRQQGCSWHHLALSDMSKEHAACTGEYKAMRKWNATQKDFSVGEK